MGVAEAHCQQEAPEMTLVALILAIAAAYGLWRVLTRNGTDPGTALPGGVLALLGGAAVFAMIVYVSS